MPPHQYFYRDTISRRIANQGWKGSLSPWDEAIPRWINPVFLGLEEVIIIIIIIIIVIIIVLM